MYRKLSFYWILISWEVLYLSGSFADVSSDVVLQRTRSLTNIFENSQVQSAYDYAENLDDGRGVTFGMIGFTTNNGDGVKVIQRYQKKKPTGNVLAPFLNALTNGGKGLNAQDFIAAVKKVGKDPLFADAQEEIWREEYWNFSQNKAKELGLKLALSKAQLYDAWVQHGEEDEPGCCKGTAGIIRATNAAAGRIADGEKDWIREFLRQRRRALTSAKGSTSVVWKESTPRIDVFESLIIANAWKMDKSLSIGKFTSGAYSSPNKHYGVFFIS